MEKISASLKSYLDKKFDGKNLNKFFVQEFENNADEIIAIILKDIRNSSTDVKYILDSFKNKDEAIKWYYSEEGYIKKYTNFFYALIGESKKPEHIVKYFPNLAPWVYARSFDTKEMGEVPASFNNKTNLIKLIEKIIKSKALAKLKKIKDYDHNPKKFYKEQPKYKKSNFNCFFEKSRILKEIIAKNIEKEITFKIDGNQYFVEPMCNPFTNKVVFKVTSKSDNQLYILKISPNNVVDIKSDSDAKAKENQMLRGDSPYLNAVVDFYLKLNNCENAANVLYYNHDYDFVLYKADEGKETEFSGDELSNLYKFNKEKIADTNKLGVYMNDLNNGNFFKTNDGRLIIIDSGHVSYSSLSNPGVLGCTVNLSNLCGRSLISTFGSNFMNE